MSNYKLNKIEIEDYEKIKSYFALRSAKTCESIVNSSFIWRDYYNARYYINEYGMVLLFDVGEGVFTTSPLCKKEDIKACVKDMRQYFKDILKEDFVMYLADEDTVQELLEEDTDLEIEEDRRYFDYIYDAEKLRTLSGKKYHKKKNHLNAFIKEYEGRYTTKRLSPKDADIIMEFIERWHQSKEIQDEYHRDQYEIEGIKRFLAELKDTQIKTNMEMYGVFIDGVMEAFTMGTYLKDIKTSFVHVEKANPMIRGLYVFVNKSFQEECFPEAEYVNREDDMGLEGIRQAKMSYNPVRFEKKYDVKG